jgi:hypothetical protein
MSDPDYCIHWFGCYSVYNHWQIMLLNLFSSLTAFALAYVLYHVFRQRKLLMMPLVLGGLCLLLVLWGFVGDAGLVAAARTYRDDRVSLRVLPGQQREEDYYAALTLLALGATGLLLLGGGMKVLVEWPGALYEPTEPRRTAGRQRRP